MNIRRAYSILSWTLALMMLIASLIYVFTAQGKTNDSPPPLNCPANTITVRVVDVPVRLLKGDLPVSYNVNLPVGGNATLYGYARNWQTYQMYEMVVIRVDGTHIGTTADLGRHQWSAWSFSAGTLNAGSHTLDFEHVNQGGKYESVSFTAILCIDPPLPALTPTLTPTSPSDPTHEPTVEVTDVPVPTDEPFIPYIPPKELDFCAIPDVPHSVDGLRVYNYEMVSWDNVKNAYVIFALDPDHFPSGTSIPITYPDGSPFLIVTFIGNHLCIPDETAPIPEVTAEPPCMNCPAHQDEVLRLDANGNYSMTALLWSPDGLRRLFVSTAPFDVVCPADSLGVISEFSNNVKGTTYYVLWSDGSCVTVGIQFWDYAPCTLTWDTERPYWYDEVSGSVLLFPGQAPSEIQSALATLELEAEPFMGRVTSRELLFTGVGWYTLE